MLTAKADIESKLKGLEKGADAYLAKPFHKEELLIRLEKLLELRTNLLKRYRSVAGLEAQENFPINLANSPSSEDHFLRKVKELVESHIDNCDFSAEQFYKEMGMSRSQLHRKLTALTGLSPIKYIRHIRLHKAKELLQQADVSISSVAYDTGFNDPAYFGRVFKKEFGLTPFEWKEKGEISNRL